MFRCSCGKAHRHLWLGQPVPGGQLGQPRIGLSDEGPRRGQVRREIGATRIGVGVGAGIDRLGYAGRQVRGRHLVPR